jgi:polysaccharide export outer membrane protein
MRSSHLFHIFIMVFITTIMSACGTGGKVVKVTTVKESGDALKEDERKKLDEIREKQASDGLDPRLTEIIEETPHYSVSEYLTTHPAVRVSSDGYISFPLIGRIKVDNLSVSEIEKLISKRLAEEQYLLDAHVSVLVHEYNSKRFLVLGAVTNPGSFSLKAQERVLDALSRAGGIRLTKEGAYAGAGRSGKIIRTENPNLPYERKIVIDLDLQGLLKGRDQVSNLCLMDKDVVYIPTSEDFYIMGQVNKPGSYPLTDKEITLIEAIGMAGGFTPIAARNRTRIIRVEEGVEKIIHVKVDAITNAGKKIQDVIIQPNDVIVVPESFF